jgi:hypothetical protein
MLKTDFNPESVTEVETEWSRRRKKVSRAKLYVCPVAVSDIKIAVELGGSCLAVLLAILFRADTTKRRGPRLTLPTDTIALFGINKSSKQRALKRLEQAKLIEVQRSPGHSPIIKLRTARHARPRRR